MPGRKARQLELPLHFRRDEDVARASISLGASLVTYAVRRTRRRRGSYTLAIDERGLRIGVPWNATQHWIEDVLQRHGKWILKKLAEWGARRAPDVSWRDGTLLMFLGTPLRLSFAPANCAPMRENGRLLVYVGASCNPSDIARTVTEWMRGEALACFRARIAHYAPRLNVIAREVRLSGARTRWGSCHPTGRILLNWRLIQMPLELVDYVVVHELAHLREMNHLPRFWSIVAEVVPDYAACRRAIRDEGHRYLLL